VASERDGKAQGDNHHVFREIRQWFDPREVRETGDTPDYRFSLANERTFLAWLRTALALVAGGLAVAQFINTPAAPHLGTIIAVVLLILGGVGALRAVDHWIRCEKAMRIGEDLPASRFPAILAIVVAIGAIGLLVLVIAGSFQR
jgi:putative membrane protein